MINSLTRTGSLLGRVISDIGVNKLAVVIEEDTRSIALGVSTLSSFLSLSTGTGKLFFPYQVKDLLDYDPQVLLLSLFEKGSLPHLREALERGSFDIITSEELLEDLLDTINVRDRDIYVFTLDIDEGKLYLGKYLAGDISLLFEYDITVEHARSVREGI